MNRPFKSLARLPGLAIGLLLAFALAACIQDERKEPSPEPVLLSQLTLTGRLDSIKVSDSSALVIDHDTTWQSGHLVLIENVIFPDPLWECLQSIRLGRGPDATLFSAGSWSVGQDTDTSAHLSDIYFPSPLDSAFTHYRIIINCDIY